MYIVIENNLPKTTFSTKNMVECIGGYLTDIFRRFFFYQKSNNSAFTRDYLYDRIRRLRSHTLRSLRVLRDLATITMYVFVITLKLVPYTYSFIYDIVQDYAFVILLGSMLILLFKLHIFIDIRLLLYISYKLLN